MKLTALLLILGLGQFVFASQKSIRLVIKKGELSLADGEKIPYFVYTESVGFPAKSDLLVFHQGDELTIKVVNMDSRVHGFGVENQVYIPSIPPGDSATQVIQLTQTGVFRYYDPINFPWNTHTGLGSFIHVKSLADNSKYFYWELREHQLEWNTQIEAGSFPIINSYDPTYFSINGNYDPYVNMDTIARVTGNVDKEFRIIIMNHGLGIHSMHFHGYHLTIEKDSKNNTHIGRSKDTFPLYPNHYLELSCTPDKPGEYPVHDHNLVAVTGGGIYHAGMFTTLLIEP